MPDRPAPGDEPVPPRRPKAGGVNGGDRTSEAARVEAANRRARLIQLRNSGMSFDRIQEVLGYESEEGAYKAWRAELAKVPRAAAKEALRLEELRLDQLQLGFYAKAITGNVSAGETVLKIMAARAKLLGLNGAVKIDLTTDSAAEEVKGVADELMQRLLDMRRGDDE